MGSFPATLSGAEVPAGNWTTAATGSFLTLWTVSAGFSVDFPFTVATDRAIVLDPPTFTDFNIVMVSTNNNGLNFFYSLWIEDNPAPEEFSATHLPNDVILAGDVIEVVPFGSLWNTGLVAGQELSFPVDLGELFPLYRQSTWNARINFIWQAWSANPLLTWRWNSHLNAAPPRYDTEEIAFVAGLSGYDVRAQSRVDRCDRCGSYDLRERFTDDGYSKGLSVCRDCWDPEDPPTRPIPPDLPPIND